MDLFSPSGHVELLNPHRFIWHMLMPLDVTEIKTGTCYGCARWATVQQRNKNPNPLREVHSHPLNKSTGLFFFPGPSHPEPLVFWDHMLYLNYKWSGVKSFESLQWQHLDLNNKLQCKNQLNHSLFPKSCFYMSKKCNAGYRVLFNSNIRGE